jgi:hypothetical protein
MLQSLNTISALDTTVASSDRERTVVISVTVDDHATTRAKKSVGKPENTCNP